VSKGIKLLIKAPDNKAAELTKKQAFPMLANLVSMLD
jgi:hypothetical protein